MQESDVKRIVKLLQSGASTVKRSASWDKLFTDESIGQRIGKVWQLSQHDLRSLRSRVSNKIGQDPRLSVDFNITRIQAAEKFLFEKLSTKNVFAEAVLLARLSNLPLPIINEDGHKLYTVDNSFLGCYPHQLDTQASSKFIVIENGALMMHWKMLQLPTDWLDATFLYRGHGSNATHVNEFLKLIPRENVAYFHDFDPSGLAMSLRTDCAMVIPANLDKLKEASVLEVINQRERHFIQLGNFRAQAVTNEHRHFNIQQWMLENQIAIMQEHLVAHQIPLQVF